MVSLGDSQRHLSYRRQQSPHGPEERGRSMSKQSDELLYGTGRGTGPDSDGDGVSDVQEGVDGTDPNDANSSIRHDQVISPVGGEVVYGAVGGVVLERETIVDVAGSLPAGRSLEQGLGTGLDGKPIDTSVNRHGVGEDQLLVGRGVDANSPLNMNRDPLASVAPTGPATGPGAGQAVGKDTVGGAGQSSANKGFDGGSGQSGPPPGAELSGRAPNMGLVSGAADDQAKPFDESKHKGPFDEGPGSPKDKFKTESGKTPGEQAEEWKKKTAPKDGGMTDPDAPSDGGVLTEADIARAIAVRDGATDFVEGHEGVQIEDGPRPLKRDLVTDGGDEDPTAGETGTMAPPGQEISKPVNPQDGLPGSGPPPGPGPGGGDGGDNTGRQGASAFATAATDTGSSGAGSGVINIGGGSTSGSTGGIQSTAGDNAAPPTDESGRVSHSSAMMAGPGTQTEDEVYIGATSAPVDPTGNDSSGGSGGGDGPAPAETVPAETVPVATVAEVFAPIVELQIDADVTGAGADSGILRDVPASPRRAAAPVDVASKGDGVEVVGAELVPAFDSVEPVIPTPLDPVADAMTDQFGSLDNSHDDTFAPPEIDADDLMLVEVELDDGI